MFVQARSFAGAIAFVFAIGLAPVGLAQRAPTATQPRAPVVPPIGTPHVELGPGPFVLETAEQPKIRVSVIARGIPHPWSLAFLPNGDMLVTERAGRLRIVHNGVLDPQPVSGLPKIDNTRMETLFDLALHPNFAQNRLIYFTHVKAGEDKQFATALARGRFNGTAFTDVRDIFVGEWSIARGGSRIVFGRDGTIYMTTGDAFSQTPQDTNSDYGKVLRLRDDGSVPADNPFVGRAGYKPEIYTIGHRDQDCITLHPATGEIYQCEHGPNGGDEINLILPGRNYGWPLVSYGRAYDGTPISPSPVRDGIEPPIMYWVPGIAPSGMVFYSGDRFPAWKGNAFVGSMRRGEITTTGNLQRVVFNDKMQEIRVESLLTELKQRIRDVRQGPDGYLYVLTEEEDGALLKIEPAP